MEIGIIACLLHPESWSTPELYGGAVAGRRIDPSEWIGSDGGSVLGSSSALVPPVTGVTRNLQWCLEKLLDNRELDMYIFVYNWEGRILNSPCCVLAFYC